MITKMSSGEQSAISQLPSVAFCEMSMDKLSLFFIFCLIVSVACIEPLPWQQPQPEAHRNAPQMTPDALPFSLSIDRDASIIIEKDKPNIEVIRMHLIRASATQIISVILNFNPSSVTELRGTMRRTGRWSLFYALNDWCHIKNSLSLRGSVYRCMDQSIALHRSYASRQLQTSQPNFGPLFSFLNF